MRAIWTGPVRVSSVEGKWESWPATPGVYIIRAGRNIHRLGGTDKTGILYFGKARRLKYRVWSFLKANHTASGFLWTHPEIARLVLDPRIRAVSDVEECIGGLKVAFATPLSAQELERAERALMFSYIRSFGEAPPLNLSVVRRWDLTPPAQDLRWAEAGIDGVRGN